MKFYKLRRGNIYLFILNICDTGASVTSWAEYTDDPNKAMILDEIDLADMGNNPYVKGHINRCDAVEVKRNADDD